MIKRETATPLSLISVNQTGTDLNDYRSEGIYFFNQSPTNKPADAFGNGWCMVFPTTTAADFFATQIWFSFGSNATNPNNKPIFRRTYFNGTWSDWIHIAVEGEYATPTELTNSTHDKSLSPMFELTTENNGLTILYDLFHPEDTTVTSTKFKTSNGIVNIEINGTINTDMGVNSWLEVGRFRRTGSNSILKPDFTQSGSAWIPANYVYPFSNAIVHNNTIKFCNNSSNIITSGTAFTVRIMYMASGANNLSDVEDVYGDYIVT